MAIPVTFGEPRRLAIFAYIALKTEGQVSSAEFLEKFQRDHPYLESAISRYREDCLSKSARKLFQTGLPSFKAERSLVSYGRGAHGLGLITWTRRRGVVVFKPNWRTVATQALGKFFHYDGMDFEMPIAFKLLMAQQIISNDWEMTGALVSSINRAEENNLTIDRLAMQVAPDYAKFVMRNILRKLGAPRSPSDRIWSGKRVDFFARNLELIRSGRSPTSGFSHQLEARLHWLVDLRFVDLDYICEKDKIRLSSFLRGPSDGDETWTTKKGKDTLLAKYASFLTILSGLKPHEDYSVPTDVSSIVESSISLLRTRYKELIPADAVILITRILSLLALDRPLERNEVLEDISNRHRLYRDWRGRGAFIE